MRLLSKPRRLDDELNRNSGWPYIIKHIQTLDTNNGIIFDDSIEQTFTHGKNEIQHDILQEQPWIAMAHVPPFTGYPFMLQSFIDYANSFAGSDKALKNLIGICTMSENLADRLRQVCNVPVHAIKYATNINVEQFNISTYLRNPQIIHVGWFLKNLLFLEHLPQGIQRKIFIQSILSQKYVQQLKSHIQNTWYSHRKLHGGVEYIDALSNQDYDQLLTQSIVAIEFIDCAAATTIVEAMARCVPMLVNRHPAVVEYLGRDYPMFFDDIRECESLLKPVNVIRTHEYIQKINKDFLSIDNFMKQFQSWVSKYEKS